MFRKITSVLTLLCLVIYLQGCYTQHQISSQNLKQYPDYRISKVETTEGEVIKFDTRKDKQARVVDDKIEGYTKDKAFKSIPLSRVDKIHLTKYDKNKTLTWAVGTAVAVAIVAAVIAASQGSDECTT